MRKIIINNNEVIIDDVNDRHVSRNKDSKVVGKSKKYEEDLAKRRKKN